MTTTFSAANVRRWNASRKQAKASRRIGDVDWCVRLYRTGKALWWTCVFAAGCGIFFIGYQIADAFVSGRVQEIVNQIGAAR